MNNNQRVKARKNANGGRYDAHGGEKHIYGNILVELIMHQYEKLSVIKLSDRCCSICILEIKPNKIGIFKKGCRGCKLEDKCVRFELETLRILNCEEMDEFNKKRGIYVR